MPSAETKPAVRRHASFLAVLLLLSASMPQPASTAPRWAIVVHGGAGAIEPKTLVPEQEAAYRAARDGAARAGADVLRGGGGALDAVEAAIKRLEDDPLFNAGRGAVFTADGKNELDAAIMYGRDMTAGAVAGGPRTRPPL